MPMRLSFHGHGQAVPPLWNTHSEQYFHDHFALSFLASAACLSSEHQLGIRPQNLVCLLQTYFAISATANFIATQFACHPNLCLGCCQRSVPFPSLAMLDICDSENQVAVTQM